MKTTHLFATVLAAALATSPALACPADPSLGDGPAATPVHERHAGGDEPRACVVRVPGNPKMTRPPGRVVNCVAAFARRPAERRDAA
jgi:hypothetical protein